MWCKTYVLPFKNKHIFKNPYPIISNTYINPTKLGVYWNVIRCGRMLWIDGIKHEFYTPSLLNLDSNTISIQYF